MPASRMVLVAVVAAVLPLSGCTEGQGAALAHAAEDGLHVHVSDGEGDSILRNLQLHDPGLSKPDFVGSFKEHAEQADEDLREVGELAGCQAVEYREEFGVWPGTPAAVTLNERTANSSVMVEVLYAVCKADEAGKSGF